MMEDLIRSFVKCCSCGGSLKSSKHTNGVTLDKLATWKCPIWGNVLSEDRRPRALGFVCDQCIRVKAEVKYAVEWNPSLNTLFLDEPSYAVGKRDWYKDMGKKFLLTIEESIKYHPISELENLPKIKIPKDGHKDMTNKLEGR